MRRTFVESISPGTFTLAAAEAHHLRDVLRLSVGDVIELFDRAGHRAAAQIESIDRDGVVVRADRVDAPNESSEARQTPSIHVASAVPKADRADWLVEKLSELGVARWTPLRTARSVVHPEGVAKYDRWRRLAIEAAKQSRRAGVMTIDEMLPLESLLSAATTGTRLLFSTRPTSRPIGEALSANENAPEADVQMFVGPEGGWTEGELAALTAAGAIETSLGTSILRIETAAVVGAGVIAAGVGSSAIKRSISTSEATDPPATAG